MVLNWLRYQTEPSTGESRRSEDMGEYPGESDNNKVGTKKIGKIFSLE